MLAISAARISTASSPSRKTMIALFVTTETRDCGPLPMRASASASAASSDLRVAASSVGAARPLISCTRPASPPAPYQNRLSIRWKRDGASPRRRCSGPSSKIP
jgi:hypothetical protein